MFAGTAAPLVIRRCRGCKDTKQGEQERKKISSAIDRLEKI
jgi:hypothetical protein